MIDGVQMRKTMLSASKPLASRPALESNHRVLYKGPFPQVTLEDGRTLRRGEFVAVSAALYQSLRRAAERAQTVVLRGANEELRLLLVLTRLDDLFELDPPVARSTVPASAIFRRAPFPRGSPGARRA